MKLIYDNNSLVIQLLWRQSCGTVWAQYQHSYKKQKDNLETWAVLLIFSLEHEISGVTVQSVHQNSEKW